MPSSTCYAAWDCALPDALPRRSHLHHLKPIGVGTIPVESLTGYIARLAEAHHVPTGVLLTREVHPQLRLQSTDSHNQGSAKPNYSFIYDAHVLNGSAACPRKWVQALEALTAQAELSALTMLPWRQVISDRHLLRSRRAWCPACFELWRKANLRAYEPLLWAIGFVSVCPVHRFSLQERCPHCGQGSTMLTAKARPGYCYHCRHWLGTPPSEPTDATASAVGIAAAVGGLLAFGSGLSGTPSSVHFKQNLRRCVDEFAGGNLSHFARITDTPWDCLHHWLNESSTIGLDSVVRMCCKLELSTARFLGETIPVGDPDWEHARGLVHQASRQGAKCRNAPVIAMPTTGPSVKRTRDSIRPVLEAALRKPNPPSLQAVARQLGYCTPSSLLNWHPDLCSALAAKRRERSKAQDEKFGEAIVSLLAETPALSVREVSAQVGLPIYAIRKRFPELTALLVARAPERRQHEHDLLAKRLQSSLAVTPPPSMTELARSLGKSRDYLKTLFPDLSQQIRDRYLQSQKEASAKKHQRFRGEIRRSVAELCRRGVIPSRKRVMAAIVNPSMRSTHILDDEMAQTLLDLDTKPSAPSKSKAAQPDASLS